MRRRRRERNPCYGIFHDDDAVRRAPPRPAHHGYPLSVAQDFGVPVHRSHVGERGDDTRRKWWTEQHLVIITSRPQWITDRCGMTRRLRKKYPPPEL